MIELGRPGRAHAAAGKKVRRFLGRQSLDRPPLLTAIAGGLRGGRARKRQHQQA
jgi:hypothetical protein